MESRAKGDCYSDCIIGYKIDWKGVKDHDEGYRTLGIYNYPFNPSVTKEKPGFMKDIRDIKIQKDKEIYIRFSANCQNKEQYIKDLLAHWYTLSDNIPKLTRIPDPIFPSAETIGHSHEPQCPIKIPQEMRVRENAPPSECIIGYNLDWAGVKLPERGQRFNFHPAHEHEFWQGKVIPDFARYVYPYGPHTYSIPNIESGLSTDAYFYIIHKQYCAKKEELTKQYFDFWRSRGLVLPHIERIPDPIKPFTKDEIKARDQAMWELEKSLGIKPRGQCLLDVHFDWTGVPKKELNRSTSLYIQPNAEDWWNKEIPEFALAIKPLNEGGRADGNNALIRKFYEVDSEYCFKKEKLFEDYIAYLRTKYEWVPKYEIMPDDRTQSQFKAANIVQKYKEKKSAEAQRTQQFWVWFKLPNLFKPSRKKKKHMQPPNTCVIAFDYDWSGLKGTKLLSLPVYSSAKQKNIWGDNAPDFAKYIIAYGTGGGAHHDERMLPTRIYYWIENAHCDKKEQYMREYMEFWRSQSKTLPKVKRVPDNEIPDDKKQ